MGTVARTKAINPWEAAARSVKVTRIALAQEFAKGCGFDGGASSLTWRCVIQSVRAVRRDLVAS